MPKANPKETSIVKPKRTLAEVVKPALAAKKGDSDNVVIGSSKDDDAKPEDFPDLDDVAEITGNVEWMVRGYIPFGMPTLLVAEPGVGKSALTLGGPVKSITTGSPFFDGSPGPKKPGYVIWCDTECGSGITVGRMKKWGLPGKYIKIAAPLDLKQAYSD
jgi:hypothetical protein